MTFQLALHKKKLPFLLVLVIFGQSLCAQTFTKVRLSTPFEGVFGSSLAFSDVDGDGDQDFLLTGATTMAWTPGGSFPDGFIAKLYLNDGIGNFSDAVGTPFEAVYDGSLAFSDVDSDGDEDVLILGEDTSFDPIAKLYTNDGTGNFTEVTATPFVGVYGSALAFADVDGDGDEDVLITGRDTSFAPITNLYTNDGTGSFTEATGMPFTGVFRGSLAFSDVDGDGDQDVLITGEDSSEERTANLYTNDGTGVFTVVPATPFEGVFYSALAFSDVDGDGDQDVLITGQDSANAQIATLYTNDGIGNFSEATNSLFESVIYGSLAFSDVDGDGDQDVLISSWGSAYESIATLSLNDGAGNFSEATASTFTGGIPESIAFSDVDGDGDQDVLLAGGTTILHINDGTGNFQSPFEPMRHNCSLAFSDVDGDGDQDVLTTGYGYLGIIAKMYINDGSGSFTERMNTPFEGVDDGSVAFSDVDGDGDEDVLITGSGIAKLYTNDGIGNFSEVIGTPFVGVGGSAIAFADVDGDGDEDVLITGRNSPNIDSAKLYINDGTGSFTERMSTPFVGLLNSALAFSDVDGDGDQDILITGWDISNIPNFTPIAKLYLNIGIGYYYEASGPSFEDEAVFRGSFAFSDVDGDGDEDVLIVETDSSFQGSFTKLYTNDGFGNFSEVSGTAFEGLASSEFAFSDVDGDGDKDLFMTGRETSSTPSAPISKLYINDGLGNFSEAPGTAFEGLLNSAFAFADVDGDGDEDVLMTGSGITNLYLNEGIQTSIAAPSTPDRFDFLVFPNPVSGNQLNIRLLSETRRIAIVSVIDLNGRLLMQQEEELGLGEQTLTIDISTLSAGNYILRLEDGVRQGVGKFVVQ